MQGFHEPQSANSIPEVSPGGSALLPVITRLGVPVLLFGLLFLLLVWILALLTSPDRFPVHAGDSLVRLADLETRFTQLEAEKSTLEKARHQLNIGEKAPILTRVMTLRAVTVPLGDILLSVEEVRHSFQNGADDPISLPRVEYKDHTLLLAGDLRDTSGRSMQVLAEFVDRLRDIPGVTDVSEPEYVSQTLSGGASVSPFILTLTLRRA